MREEEGRREKKQKKTKQNNAKATLVKLRQSREVLAMTRACF